MKTLAHVKAARVQKSFQVWKTTQDVEKVFAKIQYSLLIKNSQKHRHTGELQFYEEYLQKTYS